jgi:TP901 family phage tail tape measure protein
MSKKLTVDIEARDNASDKIKKLNKELTALDRAYKVSQDTLRKQGDSYKTLQHSLDHYTKAIKISEDKIKNINTALRETFKERTNEKKALKETQESLKKLQDGYTKNKEVLKNVRSEFKNIYSEKKQLIKAYDEESKKLKILNDRQKEIAKTEGKKSQAYKIANAEVQKQKTVVDNLSKSIKNNANKHQELRKELRSKYDLEKKLTSNIKKHENNITKLSKKTDDYKRQLNLANEQLKNHKTSLKYVNDEYKKDTIKKQIDGMKKYREQLQKTAEAYNKVGNALLKMSAPALAFTAFGIKEAIAFESAFAGVRKTVDATDEQFAKLKKTITSMSERLPQSANEIAKVMEMAGQLGIGINDIEKFSETMIKLGDSTNLASDEAAKLLAQYTNITNMDKSNIDRLASTIVDLGNNTATTEADIVSMMHSLAGMGANFKLTDHQIAGISATLTSVGIASEKGGTAMGKFMMKVLGAGGRTGAEFRKMGKEAGLTDKEIQKMAKESGQQLHNFSNIAGVSADKFKEIVKNNPSEALRLVVEGLGKMKESGQDITPVLDTLGIKEVRLRDTVLRLAGGHRELTKNLNLSKKAWEENTALETEAQKRYQTTESQLKMLKNQFSNVARELAVEFLPMMIKLMQNAKAFLNWIRNLDTGFKQLIVRMAGLTAGLGAVFKTMGMLNKFKAAIVGINLALGKMTAKPILEVGNGGAVAMKNLGSAVGLTTKGMGLLNPVTAGVAAAIVGCVIAYKTWNDVLADGNKTILDAKDNMTLWDKWINLFTGSTKKSSKELEEQGYKFSETGHLSTEFAKKVQVARESTGRLALELERLGKSEFKAGKFDNISTDISKSCDTAIKTLQGKQQEIQQATKEAFSRDGVLSEEEQKTLDWLNKDTNVQIQHLGELEKEKNDIIKKAYNEKRNLTKAEEQRLLEIKKEINKIDLDNSAKTQEDLLYMKNKFINEMGKLDLKGQSEMLKEKKAQADKEIADIKAQWDTKIELAKQKAKELSGKEKEEAEQAIKVMEETRDKDIENAKKHYNDLLEAVKEKYPQIAKEINDTNGEILSNNDKTLQKDLNNWQKHHEEMYTINETGWNEVLDTTTGTTKRVFQIVDETTGKVIACYDNETGEIHASTEASKKKLQELMKTTQFTQTQMGAEFLRLTAGLTNSTKLNVAQLKHLEQQMGFTRDSAGNLNGTITDLNGNPVKVTVNKDGTIRNLDEVRRKINSIPERKNVTINVQAVGNLGAVSALYGHASGTNYLRGYASGTNYLPSFANGGMVRTRVNEMGWELFDLPRGTAGRMLGTHRGDDIMDLPTGTKITNHIASTKLMIEAVKKEVKRQMQPIYRGIDNMSRGREEKVIKQEVTVHFDNVVIRDDRDIKNIMQEMKYELNKEVY